MVTIGNHHHYGRTLRKILLSPELGNLKYVNDNDKQNTRSKDSLNRSQYTNTALLDTTP